MIERRRGDCVAAHATLTAAKTLADQCEDALLSAEILREMGQVCIARGEPKEAAQAYQTARDSFTNLGAASDVTTVTTQLHLIR